jgi:hypothetical protein
VVKPRSSNEDKDVAARRDLNAEICLSIRPLLQHRFLRMFALVRGRTSGRHAWDRVLSQSSQGVSPDIWSPDVHGREWVLYTMHERDRRSSRFKSGHQLRSGNRATALNACGRTTVRVFASKAAAFVVEQGLHGLLYRYQDRRRRRAGVHGGHGVVPASTAVPIGTNCCRKFDPDHHHGTAAGQTRSLF